MKAKRYKHKKDLVLEPDTDLIFIIKQGEDKGEHPSKLLDSAKSGYIIEYPKKGESLLKINIGDKILCRANTKSGNFEFESRVAAIQIDPEAFLYIIKPYNVYKLQFRSFARVDTMINAEIARWDEEQEIDILVKIPCKIINISGGGIAIKTGENFSRDDKLLASFILPGNEISLDNIVCKVVKVVKGTDNEFKAFAEFVSIKDSDRDLVIHYVYSEQIRMRRKGMM